MEYLPLRHLSAVCGIHGMLSIQAVKVGRHDTIPLNTRSTHSKWQGLTLRSSNKGSCLVRPEKHTLLLRFLSSESAQTSQLSRTDNGYCLVPARDQIRTSTDKESKQERDPFCSSCVLHSILFPDHTPNDVTLTNHERRGRGLLVAFLGGGFLVCRLLLL